MLHVPASSSSYTAYPHVTRPATRVGANSGYCRADGSCRAAQPVQPPLQHDRVESAP
jgi:hypothetical protein